MTDELRHTNGPWKVGYRAMDVMATDAKGDFKVCDIRGWGHLTGKGHGALGLPEADAIEIQTANANLIAAAPDLLLACKRMVNDSMFKDHPEASQMAIDAIAKATIQN